MAKWRTSPPVPFLAGAFFLGCLLVDAGQAMAVQQHGGAEGLVAHQAGHFLFITGMLLFLYRMRLTATGGPGWTCFRLFLWLLILWNMLTFYGHLQQELIGQEKYIMAGGRVTGFALAGPLDVLFYISRLDHLLLVPAFVFLLLALVKWRRQP